MNALVRWLMLLSPLFAFPSTASAVQRHVSLRVTFDGRPAREFLVEYFDSGRTLRATTNARGVVVFDLTEDLKEWNLTAASNDYVFRDLRGENRRWSVRAVRSATWRQRTHRRPCDEWRRTLDIPRGSLSAESAEEYDDWYASLSHETEANCVVLGDIEAKIGSKAPWYLYEFKAMPPGCVDGKYLAELDWTAWYRRLLEEATGAAPGVCLSDWESWWAQKGFPPLPQRPAHDSLPPN